MQRYAQFLSSNYVAYQQGSSECNKSKVLKGLPLHHALHTYQPNMNENTLLRVWAAFLQPETLYMQGCLQILKLLIIS